MPNTGGPRSSGRELYALVIDSILLYGAPIWRCATETQAYIRQAEAVHRRACLRVISGRSHVSYDATYVIAGVLTLALLADERARIYQRRPEDVKEEERRETLSKWRDRWVRATKGRWTHRLIPNITEWVERGHREVNHYPIQLLSGHGYFKSHSQCYDNTFSALCPACRTTIEDAEHVFFRCPRFHEERERLQQVLQEEIEPEIIARLMLETASNRMALASFAQSVVTRLRQEAQEDAKSCSCTFKSQTFSRKLRYGRWFNGFLKPLHIDLYESLHYDVVKCSVCADDLRLCCILVTHVQYPLCYACKIFNKSPIITRKSKKLSDIFNCFW
ncbi:unnamed protein product, partial [Trichogramma brassicae]